MCQTKTNGKETWPTHSHQPKVFYTLACNDLINVSMLDRQHTERAKHALSCVSGKKMDLFQRDWQRDEMIQAPWWQCRREGETVAKFHPSMSVNQTTARHWLQCAVTICSLKNTLIGGSTAPPAIPNAVFNKIHSSQCRGETCLVNT